MTWISLHQPQTHYSGTAYWSFLVPSQVRAPSSQMHSTMCLVGKHPGQVLMVTNTTGLTPSRLLFVTDRPSSLHFLVDTGAEVNIIPVICNSRSLPNTGHILQGVISSPIATYSTASHTLTLGIPTHFSVDFLGCPCQTRDTWSQLPTLFQPPSGYDPWTPRRCHYSPAGQWCEDK